MENENGMGSCPRCSSAMQKGFSCRGVGVSFVSAKKLKKFIFFDEDIARAGLRKFLPHKAEYFSAFYCGKCKFFAVDLSKVLSRADAERLAGVED